LITLRLCHATLRFAAAVIDTLRYAAGLSMPRRRSATLMLLLLPRRQRYAAY